MKGNGSANTSVAMGTNNCDAGNCDGANGSMTYCAAVTFGAEASSAGTVDVTFDASTTCTNSTYNKTPSNDTWDVNFLGGNNMQNNDTGGTTIVDAEDCMDWRAGIVQNLTQLTTAGGSGSVTNVSLPTTAVNAASGQYAAVCVSTTDSFYGNQAPIAIVV